MYRAGEDFIERLNRFLPEELKIDKDFPERILDKEIVGKIKEEKIFPRLNRIFSLMPYRMGNTLIDLLPMDKQKIFVANCGDGQTLVDLQKKTDCELYAETFSPYNYYLSLLNLALNDLDASIVHKKQNAKITGKADYDLVLCEEFNPYFGRESHDRDYNYLAYLYSLLKPNGYLLLCGRGDLDRWTLRNEDFCSKIAKEIKTVIDFPNSDRDMRIVVLQKGVASEDIFFIDGSSFITGRSHRENIIKQEKLLKIYNDREFVIDYSQVVSPKKFAEKNHSLDSRNYVKVTPTKPFDIEECYGEINALKSEIAEIDQDLKSKLLK